VRTCHLTGSPNAVILRNEEPAISSGIKRGAGEEKQRSQVLRFAQNDGLGGASNGSQFVPKNAIQNVSPCATSIALRHKHRLAAEEAAAACHTIARIGHYYP